MTTESSLNRDQELLRFFTDVENLRDLFKTLVAAPELPRRILVIHGVGGIGKSSLLRMFRLHCKSVEMPVALASGDEAKSALAILGDWTDDLKADGVTLATFAKTRQHYRAIQAKAEDRAQESRKKMGDLAGKTAGKVVETAASAAVGAAIGSVIPGIGTIVGALGAMGAEALVDWLRGQGFAKPDIDLLLDPARKLTDDFLADIERVAPKLRLVLMLDTFEQLSALEDWARDLAQRLHPNVLLVIAGRAMPNWSRAWPGWLAQANVEELKPMTDDVMRELVYRYYITMRGGEPNPKQVEAIISFARGLPMVVTSAVQLWVEHGVEDFEVVKPEVVADLVDRLKEGVPEEMTPLLEAAATVRWFNKEVLRAVTGQADVNKAYDELRRFPFMRPRVEGLALHDAVREIMDEYLQVHDPGRHCELHERAAVYFEAQMAKRTGEEAERLGLERLYHRVRADEEVGIRLFQEMAEELTRYRLVNRLRALLNDANTYPLERESNKLWREYYNARSAHLETRLSDAEKVYQTIGENGRAEPRLRAYVFCDYGEILVGTQRLGTPGGKELAQQIIQKSLRLTSEPDTKIISNYLNLRHISNHEGRWDESVRYLDIARQFILTQHDDYGLAQISREFAILYVLKGDWRRFWDAQINGEKILERKPELLALKVKLLSWINPLIWMGEYSEAKHNAEEALAVALHLDDQESIGGTYRALGYALGMQGLDEQSEQAFAQAISNYRKIGRFERQRGTLGFRWAVLLKQGKLNEAEDHLLRRLTLKREIKDRIGIPELLLGLGGLEELRRS